MKLSEIMGLKMDAEFYDFGEDMVKLCRMHHDRADVEQKFYNIQLIHQCFSHTLNAIKTVEIDHHYGIVFEKVHGTSLLRMMENDFDHIESFAKLFAELHQKMHRCELEHLKTQREYYKYYIDIADIEMSVKEDLEDFLRREGPHKSLCHGNYEPDRIIAAEAEYYVLGFEDAYQGHPLSDVAKSILILMSPRVPKGTTEFLKEKIQVCRNTFIENYKKSYKLDDKKLKQYMRLAAVTRLNDHIEAEKEWLLSIINEA